MHVLIDRERMWALYKHPSLQVVSDLYHLEVTEDETCIVPIIGPEHAEFGSLTDLELRLLYKSICGQDFHLWSREPLERAVAMLLNALPVVDVNAAELNLQASVIPMDYEPQCRYARGSAIPMVLTEPETLDRLQLPGFVPTPTGAPKPEEKLHPVFSISGKEMIAKWNEQASAERVARTPNPDAPIIPPKAGSTTGRVWEICDAVFNEHPDKQSDFKALRPFIMERGESEGINGSTMSVQFSKWKQSKMPK